MVDGRGLARARIWWFVGATAMLAACHASGSTGNASGGSGGSPPSASGGTTVNGSGGATVIGSGGTAAGAGGAAPTDAGATDAADDASLAARQDQACRDAIIAQCQRLVVCYGMAVDSADACSQYADRCPSYYFNPRSLRTVESVEACIPMLKAATCTDVLLGLGSQCLDHGTGAAGAPCSSASECASASCSGLAPTCGTCSPVAATGAACGGDAGYCGSGQTCDPISRTCVAAPVTTAHSAEGQPCDLSANPPVGCEGDLVCVTGSDGGTAGTCMPLPGQGQPCLNGYPDCASGFSCGISTTSGAREALCGNPPPCGDTTCAAGSYCIETPTMPLHCVPNAQLGEACIASGGDGEGLCVTGATCGGLVSESDGDGGTIREGTCVAFQDLGAACGGDTQPCRSPLLCQAGLCVRFDPETCFAMPSDAGTD